MKKLNLGRQATKMDQLLLASKLQKSTDEIIVIHHITDLPHKLQLELERRSSRGITFERLIIT